MTIKYALTRAEILRFFFDSLRRSPKFLATILLYLIVLGIYPLTLTGSLSRHFSVADGIHSLGWMVAAFCFMVVWIYFRAKTAERTLNTSKEGISTSIGKLKGEVPWSQIKIVSDEGQYILIVRFKGNGFFVPTRAFGGPEQRAQFLADAARWRKSA